MELKKAEMYRDILFELQKNISKIDKRNDIHYILNKVLDKYELICDRDFIFSIVTYFNVVFSNIGLKKIIVYHDTQKDLEISIGKWGFKIKGWGNTTITDTLWSIKKLMIYEKEIIENLILHNEQGIAKKFKKFAKIISGVDTGTILIPLKRKVTLLDTESFAMNFDQVNIKALQIKNYREYMTIEGILDKGEGFIKIIRLDKCSIAGVLNQFLLKSQSKHIKERFEKIIKNRDKIKKKVKKALNKEFSKEMMVANL